MKRFQVCRLCGGRRCHQSLILHNLLCIEGTVWKHLCNEKQQPADLVIFSFLSFVRFLFKGLGSVLKAMKTKFISK